MAKILEMGPFDGGDKNKEQKIEVKLGKVEGDFENLSTVQNLDAIHAKFIHVEELRQQAKQRLYHDYLFDFNSWDRNALIKQALELSADFIKTHPAYAVALYDSIVVR